MSNREERVREILVEAMNIFTERNAVYGSAAERHGKILAAMFPDGLNLETATDFSRFMHFNAVIGKLNRYANNFETGGHRDSSIDPINALAMLTAFDDSIRKKS